MESDLCENESRTGRQRDFLPAEKQFAQPQYAIDDSPSRKNPQETKFQSGGPILRVV